MRRVSGNGAMALATLVCLLSQTAHSEDKPKLTTKIEFFAAYTEPAEGLVKRPVVGGTDAEQQKIVYLEPKPAITNEDFEEVKADIDSRGQLCIALTLTEPGGAKMQRLSKQQLEKLIAFVINDEVVTAPTVRSEMTRKLQITGLFTEDWVKQVVAKFNQQ